MKLGCLVFLLAIVGSGPALGAYCTENAHCEAGQYCYLNTCRSYGPGLPSPTNSPRGLTVRYQCRGTGTVEVGIGAGPYLPASGFDVTLGPDRDATLTVGFMKGGVFAGYFRRIHRVEPLRAGWLRVSTFSEGGALERVVNVRQGPLELPTSRGVLHCKVAVQ